MPITINRSLKLHILFSLATLALFTTTASANPGTAMVMVVAFHLILGNFIIGIIEWIGLALLGASKARAAIMIPANYISAWIGIMLLPFFRTLVGDDPVANIIWASWVALIVLTVIGIIIELPFIFLAFKKPRKIKRVLISAVLIHIVTGGLVGWYYANSANLSLANKFNTVPLDDVLHEYSDPELWIYYITEDNQTINRMRLSGLSHEFITDMPENPDSTEYYSPGQWLILHNGVKSERLDLYLASSGGWSGSLNNTAANPNDDPYTRHNFVFDVYGQAIKPDITTRGSIWFDKEQITPTSPVAIGNSNAAELRNPNHGGPSIECIKYNPFRPLEVTYPDGSHETYGLINAIAGTSATIKVVTVLPGDLIVFMLGGVDSTSSHGIYIASLRTHKIAKISNGRSPLVVFEEK